MSFLVIGLAYFGYGLMFWGSTLLGGGPGNTGAWPLMYTLFGIGTPPKTVSKGALIGTGGYASSVQGQAGSGDGRTSAGSSAGGGAF